jgi:hypothetical protein
VLALLPLVSLGAVTVAVANARPGWGWRMSFVRATIVCAAYMAVATELLSLVRCVTQIGLMIAWLLPLASVSWLGIRAGRRGMGLRWPKLTLPRSMADRLLLASILLILIATGLVAWFAPPNTYDSLTYHMSRVAHWAQNRSLALYPTGIPRQAFMSPGAEVAVLQVYVLGQSDRLVNFVSWFAMLASLVAVSHIAKRMGARSTGQWFAAAFAAALPMGIAQASSTMTDYVLAYWMLCVAVESESLLSRENPGVSYLGLAAGLAIWTKPTAFAFLLPFAVLDLLLILRRRQFGRAVAAIAVAAGLVLSVNAGAFARNLSVYGNPLGPQGEVGGFANSLLDGRVLISNSVRNAAFHAATPWPKVNDWITRGIIKIHLLLGLALDDPRTTSYGAFERVGQPVYDETRVGNTVQAVLILISTALVLMRSKLRWSTLGVYGLVVGCTFIVYSGLFKWQIFGSRLQLPFFLLMAPFVGATLGAFLPNLALGVLGVGLAAAAWPWMTGIPSRPLLPQPGTDWSILTRSRSALYFATTGVEPAYRSMTDEILDQGCSTVGIMLGGDTVEYPLWVLLGAPRPDLQVEWIVAGELGTERFLPGFRPCAVVCEDCPEESQEIRGVPIHSVFDSFTLYMR